MPRAARAGCTHAACGAEAGPAPRPHPLSLSLSPPAAAPAGGRAFHQRSLLASQVGCRTLFATHYHDLTRDPGLLRCCQLAHMPSALTRSPDGRGGLSPSYRLCPGRAPHGSCGIEVSQRTPPGGAGRARRNHGRVHRAARPPRRHRLLRGAHPCPRRRPTPGGHPPAVPGHRRARRTPRRSRWHARRDYQRPWCGVPRRWRRRRRHRPGGSPALETTPWPSHHLPHPPWPPLQETCASRPPPHPPLQSRPQRHAATQPTRPAPRDLLARLTSSATHAPRQQTAPAVLPGCCRLSSTGHGGPHPPSPRPHASRRR